MLQHTYVSLASLLLSMWHSYKTYWYDGIKLSHRHVAISNQQMCSYNHNMKWHYYQQISQQAEDELGCRPVRLIDGRQEIIDEVFKQRPIVFLTFWCTSECQQITKVCQCIWNIWLLNRTNLYHVDRNGVLCLQCSHEMQLSQQD